MIEYLRLWSKYVRLSGQVAAIDGIRRAASLIDPGIPLPLVHHIMDACVREEESRLPLRVRFSLRVLRAWDIVQERRHVQPR